MNSNHSGLNFPHSWTCTFSNKVARSTAISGGKIDLRTVISLIVRHHHAWGSLCSAYVFCTQMPQRGQLHCLHCRNVIYFRNIWNITASQPWYVAHPERKVAGISSQWGNAPSLPLAMSRKRYSVPAVLDLGPTAHLSPGITQSEHVRISVLPDQIGRQPEVSSLCASAESWKGRGSCFWK